MLLKKEQSCRKNVAVYLTYVFLCYQLQIVNKNYVFSYYKNQQNAASTAEEEEEEPRYQRKVLMIVADGFGYGSTRNDAIMDCWSSKAITATSMLVNAKHSKASALLVKKRRIPAGLQFNLTGGKPLSKPGLISTLVGPDQKFLGKDAFWEKWAIDAGHVQTELLAQIERFTKLTGYRPQRVTGFHQCHMHPKVYEIFATTLRDLSIFRSRLPSEFTIQRPIFDHSIRNEARYSSPKRLKFHERLEAGVGSAKHLFSEVGIKTADSFIGKQLMGLAMTEQQVMTLLTEIFTIHKTCEFMVHPGGPSMDRRDGFIGDDFVDDFSQETGREHEVKVSFGCKICYYFHFKIYLISCI